MPTSPLDELEMPVHKPEDPVLIHASPEPSPPQEAASPPPEPPPAPPPQPTVESEHLPPNFDPVREGRPGIYSTTKRGTLFRPQEDASGWPSDTEHEPPRGEPPDTRAARRLRPEAASESRWAWTWLAIALVALFVLACAHYLSRLQESQGLLDTKLSTRQAVLGKEQAALASEQDSLGRRQGKIEGAFGKLQADVDRETGGLGTKVQQLQGSVASLGRSVNSKLNGFENRLDRVEQQAQHPAPPSPQVQGEIRRQNPPIATLPIQRPADSRAVDSHDYQPYEDIVPAGGKLALDLNGRKYYEVPYKDQTTGATYSIQARPYGSSSLGTYVHVIRSNGPFVEGQHWIVTPSGGWMPVTQ